MTTFDWISLGLGLMGTLLCVYLFSLNDWNIEETLFGHTSDCVHLKDGKK